MCLVSSSESSFDTVVGMLLELLKEVVKHNVAMNVVGLADEMPILVIAKGAVILGDRRVDKL